MNRRLAVTLLLAGPLGGCAALPLAALGTVIGVGASAVSTGASVYSLGKLDSAELATADATRHAVEHAADELSYHVDDAGYPGKGEAYVYHWRDTRDSKVEITVLPRTATVTALRINVGVFGSEPVARLILERVRHRLHPDGASDSRERVESK